VTFTHYIQENINFDTVAQMYRQGWSAPRISAYYENTFGIAVSAPTILKIVRHQGGVVRKRGEATGFYMGTNRALRNRSVYSAYHRLRRRGVGSLEAIRRVSAEHNISGSTVRNVLKELENAGEKVPQ